MSDLTPVEANAEQDGTAATPGREVAAGRTDLGLAALFGLLAAAVSAIGSGYVSLWTDEAATISAATRSLPDLWRMLGTIDVVHGAYYAFMHFWTGIFGLDPFWLRLPSALAVGMAASAVYLLGRHWSGRAAGVLAAAVFTVLPRVTYLGIEARPFAFAVALAAWATLTVVVASDRPRLWRWISYAVLIAAGICVNIYLALLLPAHAVAVLRRRKARVPWLIAGGIGGLAGLPVVIAATRQTGQLGGGPLGWSEFARNVVINQWFLGETPTTTTGRSTTTFRWNDVASWWPPAAVVLAVLVGSLCVTSIVRALRAPQRPGREALWWLLPWIVVPTAVIGLYSIYVHNVYNPRYLAIAAPAIAILAAQGIVALRARWQRLLALGLVVLAALPVYLSQRQLYAKNGSDWVTVAAVIDERAVAGDGVYFAPRYALTGGLVQQTTRGVAVAYRDPFADLVDLTLETTPAVAGNLTGYSRPLADSDAELAGVDTVWVIQRVDYDPAYAEADLATLEDAGFTSSAEVWRGPLTEVIQYSRP